jgi:hypothetical protein
VASLWRVCVLSRSLHHRARSPTTTTTTTALMRSKPLLRQSSDLNARSKGWVWNAAKGIRVFDASVLGVDVEEGGSADDLPFRSPKSPVAPPRPAHLRKSSLAPPTPVLSFCQMLLLTVRSAYWGTQIRRRSRGHVAHRASQPLWVQEHSCAPPAHRRDVHDPLSVSVGYVK